MLMLFLWIAYVSVSYSNMLLVKSLSSSLVIYCILIKNSGSEWYILKFVFIFVVEIGVRC